MPRILKILVGCALLAAVAYGQPEQTQPNKLAYGADKAKVPDAIAKLKSGDFGLIHVELVAKAGAVQAIPILKEQFALSSDPLTKAKIAEALVKLGDKDDSYWNFLVQLVMPAVDSDAPTFMSFDAEGKAIRGPSPEFIAWAKAHNVSPESIGEDSVYVLPGEVMLLGGTGDKRAIPILRQALLSLNYMIEGAAAEGLAEIHDNDSIRLIISACQRAPAEAAGAIADALVYFDDPQAQSAVDTYIHKEMLKHFGRRGRRAESLLVIEDLPGKSQLRSVPGLSGQGIKMPLWRGKIRAVIKS